MDSRSSQVKLYSIQSNYIVENLKKNGYHHSKIKYIMEKYGETASIFLDSYKWYVKKAEKIVPRPEEAQSGIWLFKDPKYIEKHDGYKVLELMIPIEKIVFFRMKDWSKRLNYQYIGKTLNEEEIFENKLISYGINYVGDIYTKPYYPQLKNELIKSWDNLFQYDSKIKEKGELIFPDIQGGIWELKSEWIKSIY